jgi:hypothetical protein
MPRLCARMRPSAISHQPSAAVSECQRLLRSATTTSCYPGAPSNLYTISARTSLIMRPRTRIPRTVKYMPIALFRGTTRGFKERSLVIVISIRASRLFCPSPSSCVFRPQSRDYPQELLLPLLMLLLLRPDGRTV